MKKKNEKSIMLTGKEINTNYSIDELVSLATNSFSSNLQKLLNDTTAIAESTEKLESELESDKVNILSSKSILNSIEKHTIVPMQKKKETRRKNYSWTRLV